MISIGLTGGIGSGKTLVSKVFEKLGIPVFYADMEAKRLMNEDEEIIIQLKNRFGADVYNETGINKAKLASVIFSDNKALEEVQGITHPKVRQNFFIWANEQKSPYVILEAAILFETGGYKQMDYNILVFAPEDMRIQRVVERDNTTEEQVQKKIKNQQPDENKFKMADWVIYNDGTKMLIPQIIELDKTIKEKTS